MFVCLFVWETAFIFNLFSLQPIYHLTRKNKIGPAFIFIVLSFECWSRPFPLPASVSLLIACPFLLPSETTCMSIIVSFVILISKWKYIYIYILYFFSSFSVIKCCRKLRDSKVWLEFRLFFLISSLSCCFVESRSSWCGWLIGTFHVVSFFFSWSWFCFFLLLIFTHMTTFD